MTNLCSVFTVRTCISLILFLLVVGCTKEPEKPKFARQSLRDIAAETTLLATIADDERPPQQNFVHGAETAEQNQPASFNVIFSESGRGEAYVIERDGKVSVVHNQSKGKEYSAVGTIVLSYDGQRIAYAALSDGKWRMVTDGKMGRPYDTLLTPIFSPDCQHVAYQAKEGAKWYLVVDETPNTGTTASYTTPEFSSDSTMIVYVETAASNSEMKLIVSDLKFGKQSVKKSIGDLLFTANKDKTRIAAAQVVDNRLRIIDFSLAKPDLVHEGPLYDLIEKLTFGDDGATVTYCALRGRKRLIILDNREESLPKGTLPELPVVRPDRKGVGLLLALQGRVFLHQAFFNSKEKGKMYDEAANLAYSKDSRSYAYAARKGQNWFVVVNGKEGPVFEKVVMPVFSPDGKYLVYRARKDNRRFVVVADAKDGRTIKQHPAYEQVFQPVFTADGNSVAYGVKDGNKLIWKVEKLGE